MHSTSFWRARDPRQQLAQGADRAAARLLRIGHLEVEHARLFDRVDAAQHREQARQRDDVARNELATRGLVELQQVRAERVDDAVEALVRHRLALVAAAGEHDCVVARARDRGTRAAAPTCPCPTCRGGRPSSRAPPRTSRERGVERRRARACVRGTAAPRPPPSTAPAAAGESSRGASARPAAVGRAGGAIAIRSRQSALRSAGAAASTSSGEVGRALIFW